MKGFIRGGKLRLSKQWKIVIGILAAIFAIRMSGIHLQLMEKNYFREFSYPLEVGGTEDDFKELVKSFRNKNSEIQPYNSLYSSVKFSPTNPVCSPSNPQWLLILVKSAPGNLLNRLAIRRTWESQHPPRPHLPPVKTLFFIGKMDKSSGEPYSTTEEDIQQEMSAYGDIVEIDVLDTYYNNTLKTMMEFRYAVELCSDFKYALLIDDDYFLSIKNLKVFADKMEEQDENKLYAGYAMFTRPLRHRFFNKWFIDLEEYPFNRWPPYVTAGAIFLSKSALLDIYYASFFVKHFRFDDIYVALCARKMGLEPKHSEHFKFWDDSDNSPQKDLIAAHGFRDPSRLIQFWDVQRIKGFV